MYPKNAVQSSDIPVQHPRDSSHFPAGEESSRDRLRILTDVKMAHGRVVGQGELVDVVAEEGRVRSQSQLTRDLR